ncbi:MAG: hypothetical protein NT141_01685 [candidate division WWE3 bacterium]|nr:hypothetical protein [candidate division WWE3 bacterium]
MPSNNENSRRFWVVVLPVLDVVLLWVVFGLIYHYLLGRGLSESIVVAALFVAVVVALIISSIGGSGLAFYEAFQVIGEGTVFCCEFVVMLLVAAFMGTSSFVVMIFGGSSRCPNPGPKPKKKG